MSFLIFSFLYNSSSISQKKPVHVSKTYCRLLNQLQFYGVLLFLICFHFLTSRSELPPPFFSSHFFYNLDHLPGSITVHYVIGNLLWCFGDSRDILGKSGTRAGGGQPKNLRHWRRFFSRLPGSIDKSIRNAAYYLWCLHLFLSTCAKKLSWHFLPRFLASLRNLFP